MEDFSLAEADFQQYYGIDLDKYYRDKILRHRGFWRYARLFSELPPESRSVMKVNPVESWDYTKDVLSRILQELRIIASIDYNINRRTGTKAVKPEKHFEPDYVTEARKNYEEYLSQEAEVAEEIEQMGEFWEQRTGIKMIKSKND